MNRRVQVKRGEVWRTDPDGQWRAIGRVEKTTKPPLAPWWACANGGRVHAHGHPSRDDAISALLQKLGVDPEEHRP